MRICHVRTSLWLILLALACPCIDAAENLPTAGAPSEAADADAEETLAGHSYHGEFLNEGPRQRAHLMGGTGAVKFPVTTSSPEAQAFVEQGLGQFYGFWYLEAERSFRQAAQLDPECAMAYWGAALATRKVERRAKGFIAEAVKRKDAVTKRERMYIEALDADLNFMQRLKEKEEAKKAKDKKTDDKKSGDKQDKAEDEADKDTKAEADKDEKKSDTKAEKTEAEKKAEKELEAERKEKRAKEYTEALEAIALEFPDDIEAKALLSLQLYDNKGELPNPSILAVDGLMDKVFAAEPMHPAHHFRIHLWDYKKPEVALESAALCGPAAPAIAHMWHMPGHIYSRLKRYRDAAWQQEASARVDHAQMIRDGLLPDQIHNFAHNNEWLIRNLNHIGRADDAVDLAINMIQLPRHPKYNTLEKKGSTHYGRLRLVETLTQYERWQQAIELCQSPLLEPTDDEKQQLVRLRLLGVASFMADQSAGGEQVLADLNDQLKKKRAEQKEAGKKAADEATEKAIDAAAVKAAGEKARRDAEAELAKQASEKPSEPGAAEPDSAEAAESETAVATKATDDEESVAKQAADPKAAESKEDPAASIDQRVAAAEAKARQQQIDKHQKAIDKARTAARKPFDTPINNLVKAIAEIEGFRELAAENYDAALPLLKKAGSDVSPYYLAICNLRSGDPKTAIAALKKEAGKSKQEVLPLAWLTEIYAAAGDWKLAEETFEKLREISSDLDLEAVPFARLQPIAEQLDLPADWRVAAQPSDDLGERPDLDSLGPFRWHPSPAVTWNLTDSQGEPRSLEDYRGRPVVVIFYLGYACLHCAEQLQAFSPMAEEFAKAGIEIVAISSDPESDLQKSIKLYDDKPLPFTLISDPDLQTFKAYRAFDDFENQPLHGTFLIDSEGLIRWQDIGFEPFMKPQFVLDEAARLLKPQ
ncbi:redoxin domain-containing protein [Rosistilla oblonga]|uniref:redoxin domain-containing protein n=1 Tax=Rosistilla oblonga TaxID=2527990 RepID=UPI003A980100